MKKPQYDNYLKILKGELIPAMGCTEPIAIALAAAKAREVLGQMPDHILLRCSGNIIKNVKGVVVPNSGGQKGVEVAAVLGVVAGDPDSGLEVISGVGEKEIELTRKLSRQGLCTCELEEGEENLFIRACLTAGTEYAAVEIQTKHSLISGRFLNLQMRQSLKMLRIL